MFGLELIFGPLVVTAVLGVSTLLLLYWYTTRNHDYWKRNGIPFVKPMPIIGSIWAVFRRPLHQVECERYEKFGKIYGHFEANRALLSVGDPALLREILVKDFQHFTGRRMFITNDPIVDKMMSVVRGEDWKRIRSIVTPTFSTGKIKRMLGIFKDCAGTLVQNLKNTVEAGKPVDAKRLYGTFTMDIIASAAFSTKIDSYNDPDNQFLQVARNVFNQKFGLRFILFLVAPWLVRLLRVRIFNPAATDFFRDATLQIIQERKKTGKGRNDFLQLLLDTATEVVEENKWDLPPEKDILSNYGENEAGHQIFKTTVAKNLSMDELVAQCVIFFLAGYDTTGSTLSFVTYLLAMNPEVQERLREEVDSVIENSNGKLTYEAIQSMKYLDNVISETLRIYPPAIRGERMCDADYTLGDTGITIKKGMIVTIPMFAMHHDPANFPNPEKFDPNRFTPEERAKRDPYTYLPFGAGPRNCVGMRFALVEIKVALATVMANFRIKRSPQTKVPLEFNMGQQGLLQPKQILLEMEIRNDCPLVG